MAIYRNVQLAFWTDSKVEDDFTPEDKYFYMYLLTNPQTNICGCYEVNFSQMARHTGYSKDTIVRLLERFDKVHNVIKYDSNTKEILILRWHKYNWNKSEKVLAGVSVRQNVLNLKNSENTLMILLIQLEMAHHYQTTTSKKHLIPICPTMQMKKKTMWCI